MAKPSEVTIHPLTYAYWMEHETYDSKRIYTEWADLMELTAVIWQRNR